MSDDNVREPYDQKIQESQERAHRLELQREKAKAASEMKSQFLASMSHEIRTPMNTIIGLLDLLRTDNLDSKQISHINDIKRMSGVLLQIINDILDFHKIEAGKLELLPVHFNLYTFYSDMISRYKPMAESKLLDFRNSMAPDLPRTIFGDELRINQIITNLLSNAVKYTKKGYVEFRVDSNVENEVEYTVFTVADSGIGIKREHFDTLFDEFEQFDPHKNRGITGTGLGLSIARRLANLMEGYIRFESEYGYGSVFSFSFPLIKGDTDKVRYSEKIDHVMTKPDTKVLVVDDNTGNITVAIGLLARHGIIPQTADNGITAIEMVKANKYDLVFMDHMMPEMDGVEATAIIRQLDGEYYKKLPIIALSANAVDGAKELFFSSGMNDFVSKPIIISDLNRALKRWLPNDKIIIQKLEPVTSVVTKDETELNKLLEELVKIKDLSVTDGLSRVNGDKELYLNVLWQFCKSAEDNEKALKRFAKKGMWNDYAVRIHGLKTVFANIGNQFMSDWAFSLEDAIILGDTNKCLNETNYFCSIMMQFYMKLVQTNLMNEIVSRASKTKITFDKLKDKLEELLQACQDFHAESAEAISKELQDATFSAEVDASMMKIHDLVHSYDYDEVVEIVNGLIQRINADGD